jgi:NADH-quinone oxidoreductase subunit L
VEDEEAQPLTGIPLDWLVWATPLAAVPFVPLFGRLGNRSRELFALLVSAITAATAVLLAFSNPIPRESTISWLSPYGSADSRVFLQVRTDGLSIFLSLIVNLLGFLIVLYSVGYMKRETGLDRYYALVLLFIGSMTGLVMAGNLLQLYIFWELVGICSSFLIAFWYDRPNAVRAGLKAFIVTRVGDIGLLAGLVYIYVNTNPHTVSFAALTSLASAGLIPTTVLTIGGLLVFAGAVGKSAQFPLHVWLPDAMEGPSTVSALIHAATMVNAGVYLVARVYPIFVTSSIWLMTVGSVGIFSALIAASMAMATSDLKRILAFSTISQLGLMFAALGLGTGLGLFSAQFHLLSQAAFKALGFLAAGSVIHVLGTRDMDQMGGLSHRMPLTFLAFTFSALAMTGIPPFIGFWSKDLILTASLNAGNLLLFILVLIVSVMTAFYTFRALFRVFLNKPVSDTANKEVHESPPTMTIPLLILSSAVLLLFLSEGPLANLLGTSVSTSLDLSVVLISLLAFLAGILPAYLVYVRNGNQASHLLARYSLLRQSQRILLAGFGFDRLYDLLIVRPVMSLANRIRTLQTGILGVNLWALIIFLIVILLVVLT